MAERNLRMQVRVKAKKWGMKSSWSERQNGKEETEKKAKIMAGG